MQVQASWISPAKQVELCLLGSHGALVWNDTLPLADRLQWRERNASGYAAPTPVDVLPLEPLRLECQHFINTLAAWQQGGETPPMLPLSHGGNGLAIVQLLQTLEAQAG